MYRELISQGTIEAYLSHPVVFFQDRKWGSDVTLERNNRIKSYLSEFRAPFLQPSLPSVSPLCAGLESFVENEAPAFLSLGRRVRSVTEEGAYDGYVESFKLGHGKFRIVYDDGYEELRPPADLQDELPDEDMYILP